MAKEMLKGEALQNTLHHMLLDELMQYFRSDLSQVVNRLGYEMRFGFRTGRSSQSQQFVTNTFLDLYDLELSGKSYEGLQTTTRVSVERLMRMIEVWALIAKDELRFDDILRIDNVEQRMVALKRYGVEKMLHDAKAVSVHKSSRGNELFKIPREAGVFTQDAYYLKYSDPSTGRIYVSGVPPQMGQTGDADACMAWKHGFSTEAYKLLTQEA